jgi:hypothetical protein
MHGMLGDGAEILALGADIAQPRGKDGGWR